MTTRKPTRKELLAAKPVAAKKKKPAAAAAVKETNANRRARGKVKELRDALEQATDVIEGLTAKATAQQQRADEWEKASIVWAQRFEDLSWEMAKVKNPAFAEIAAKAHEEPEVLAEDVDVSDVNDREEIGCTDNGACNEEDGADPECECRCEYCAGARDRAADARTYYDDVMAVDL